MDSNEYRTSDLALATTLVYKGFIVDQMIRISDKRCEFVFKSDEVKETVNEFVNQKMSVEPDKFFRTISQLKTMIYSTP